MCNTGKPRSSEKTRSFARIHTVTSQSARRGLGAELEERALRQGTITDEELEGAKPDWHGEFLQWQEKKERIGGLDIMKKDGITVLELVKVLAGSLVSKKGVTLKERTKK